MITFFTTPRPFVGIFDIIQRNAISSWIRAFPGSEVIILGAEEGTAEVCRQYGLTHIPDIEYDPKIKKPYVDCLIRKAEAASKHPLMCLINADNIILSGGHDQIKELSRTMKEFVVVGQRYNIRIGQLIDFTQPAQEERLKDIVAREGKRAPHWWIDYFIYTKGAFGAMPPFIMGGGRYDNWLIEHAIVSGIPLIDASSVMRVVHQEHDTLDFIKTKFASSSHHPGVQENVAVYKRFSTDVGHVGKINFADYVLTDDGLKKSKDLEGRIVRLQMRMVNRARFTRPLVRLVNKISKKMAKRSAKV